MATTTFDFSGRRVLVTGGTGFIGSHVCRRIVKAGGDVQGGR